MLSTPTGGKRDTTIPALERKSFKINAKQILQTKKIHSKKTRDVNWTYHLI